MMCLQINEKYKLTFLLLLIYKYNSINMTQLENTEIELSESFAKAIQSSLILKLFPLFQFSVQATT